jgi:hypothetical protein
VVPPHWFPVPPLPALPELPAIDPALPALPETPAVPPAPAEPEAPEEPECPLDPALPFPKVESLLVALQPTVNTSEPVMRSSESEDTKRRGVSIIRGV